MSDNHERECARRITHQHEPTMETSSAVDPADTPPALLIRLRLGFWGWLAWSFFIATAIGFTIAVWVDDIALFVMIIFGTLPVVAFGLSQFGLHRPPVRHAARKASSSASKSAHRRLAGRTSSCWRLHNRIPGEHDGNRGQLNRLTIPAGSSEVERSEMTDGSD